MLKFNKLTLEPQWIDTNICFCGGGSSGSGTPDELSNMSTDGTQGPSAATGSQGYSNTGYRGEQSAGSPSNRGYSGPTGVGIGPGSTGTPSGNQTAGMTPEQAEANQNISNNIAAAISANQAINNPANQAISDQFSALASTPTSSVSQNVSAVSNAPSVTGLSGFNTGLSNYSGLNTGVPTGLNTGTPTSAQDVMAQATDINNNPLGVNIGGFNVAPGMVGNAPGLIGTIDFAKGGAVNQGIGSVFPYPRRR